MKADKKKSHETDILRKLIRKWSEWWKDNDQKYWVKIPIRVWEGKRRREHKGIWTVTSIIACNQLKYYWYWNIINANSPIHIVNRLTRLKLRVAEKWGAIEEREREREGVREREKPYYCALWSILRQQVQPYTMCLFVYVISESEKRKSGCGSIFALELIAHTQMLILYSSNR